MGNKSIQPYPLMKKIKRYKKLINDNSSINATDTFMWGPMHIATYFDDVDAVQELITLGYDMNVVDNDHYTPLYLSVIRHSIRTMKVLLDAGADYTIQSAKGSPPLLVAAMYNHTDSLKELIRVVDINFQCADGYSALHLVVNNNNEEAVQMLINMGANVNITDCLGMTPLMHAVSWEYLGLIELLITAGADMDITDNRGYTALHPIITGGSLQCINILLNAGIDCESYLIDRCITFDTFTVTWMPTKIA